MRESPYLARSLPALTLACVLFSAPSIVSGQKPGGQDTQIAAPEPKILRGAIDRALRLLEVASAGTADQRKCFTCHGQALPVIALSEARRRGFEIDEANLERQLDHTAAFLKRGHKDYLAGKGQGGRVDTAGYALWTLEAGHRHRSEITDAVCEYVLGAGDTLRHWKRTSNRPPSEASDFTTSYLALRALAAFGTPQQQDRIAARTAAATKGLSESEPVDTEDRVFLLRSLAYASAEQEIQRRVADALIDAQRDDGGWAQNDSLTSDAYATGTVLVALARSGYVSPSSSLYRRGIQFLLRTQHDDGSWHVISRSKPFQKYFESGFPHGKDQFISTTATAWTAIAMLLSLPESD